MGVGKSKLLGAVCECVCVHACPHVRVHSHTCRVSARCYTCSGQGQVEKKAFGCSCYSTCEAGCEADVSSSQPNARCRPRHLQPHLCLAVMERGWLSPSCLPSSPEAGKGIALMSFPDMVCSFPLQILCIGGQKALSKEMII